MLSFEAWEPPATLPPATLPTQLEQYVFVLPGALVRGPEPGDVVILVEIETYSG